MAYDDNRMRAQGFTLAELLIALAILGVIATFTIPKVLQSQQDGKYNAIAKEAVAMVSGAYSAYKLNNEPTASTSMGDLTPFMNYVKYETARTIDFVQTQTTRDCDGTVSGCLLLHNGAVLRYTLGGSHFGGTASTNAMHFNLDPDGVSGGTTDGPGKAVAIFMYYNGRVTSYGDVASGTNSGGVSYSPNSTLDPPWFSWD